MALTTGQKFIQLFTGRSDAHGLGVGRIEKHPDRPIPVELYQLHLKGEGSGLGIFPLRDDGTVLFTAIDLDQPDFDTAFLLSDMLPGRTWVEKSRSGNAHVWAFFEEPVEGWIPRGIMKFALDAIGRPEVEVFPKQDRLLEGMVGNYINLPWHGMDRPILTASSSPIEDRGGWIEEAYETRNDPEEWRVRALALGIQPPEERPTSGREQGDLGFLHDCAVSIYKNRFENPVLEGHRNAVYFHFTKQLLNYKEMTEPEARELLHELNEAADPPAPEREVDRIFNNARKGGMTSTGCDDPLMAPYVLDTCPVAHPKRA